MCTFVTDKNCFPPFMESEILCVFFWVFPRRPIVVADISEPSISSIFILYIRPLKMELIEGSETSANHNRTPGKYPKEYIQNSNKVYGFSFCNVSCRDGVESASSFNRYTSLSFLRYTLLVFFFDVIQKLDPLKSVSFSCLDNQTFEKRFASDVQVTVHRYVFL